MYCGFVSNNLADQLTRYVNLKSMIINYVYKQPISQINNEYELSKIAKVNLELLIIDGSTFYDQATALNFCYQLKINDDNLRIIFISFTKELLSKKF